MRRGARLLAGLAPVLLGVLALAACTPPPATPRPVGTIVIPPPEWRADRAGSAEIGTQWWRRFDDPVLTGLVEEALAANGDVAIALARVREARAQETIVRAQRLPTLDVGSGVGRSRTLGALGTPINASAVQPVFQTAYEIDLFGRIGSEVEAARLGRLATEAASETARLAVAAATASGYLTLRGLDARARLTRATIAARAEALRIARSRAEAGYTSQFELRLAEAEYEGTAQLLPEIELAIARQENALSVLLGDPPHAIERGRSVGELQAPPVPAGLPSDLLRRRPDIAQAELAIAASDATLAASRARFLPSVGLTGSAGAIVSSSLGDPIAIWSLGASVLAPLFEGGRLRAGVDIAEARRDQAAFTYRDVVLTAFREVEDALAAVEKLQAQRQRLEAQRDAAAEALRHATNRYRAGYSDYLAQLDAQRTLFSVELALAQVEADQLTASVALYQTMGGGWPGP